MRMPDDSVHGHGIRPSKPASNHPIDGIKLSARCAPLRLQLPARCFGLRSMSDNIFRHTAMQVFARPLGFLALVLAAVVGMRIAAASPQLDRRAVNQAAFPLAKCNDGTAPV